MVEFKTADAIGLAIYLFTYVAYHVFYYLKKDTAFKYNLQVREKWAKKLFEARTKEILGVQNLRNTTMAISFLASSCLLASFLTFDAVFKGINEYNMDTFTQIKLTIIGGVIFAAFVFFIWGLRTTMHIGFFVCLDCEDLEDQHAKKTIKALRLAAIMFHLGTRCFYLIIPLGLWILSPWAMVASSVVLIGLLFIIEIVSI